MISIGLLSDTHSHIDDKMINFLSKCDEIWHAGDIGNISIIDKLKEIKPIRAVYGNIDDNEVRQEYEKTIIFTLEQVKVIMTHIGGYPPNYTSEFKQLIKAERPKIFISGHSHILKVIYDKGNECLHINPGAAGIHGLHQKRTMVRFKIDGTELKDMEIWEHER
ncbi:MAG: metallophosphoesterase family protein [Salinivirgaceae bacterium]|nr:metallophosphoesterase family protein [Salinivirgaceae bacterium]